MELYKRDFFMNRIICGYTKYKDDDLCLYVHEPTSEILLDANEVYIDSYEEALFYGTLTESEISSFMSENFLWTEMDEFNLSEELPKKIEDLKVDLYNNFDDEMNVMIIREQINIEKEKLNDLYNKKHMFDYLTCSGVASFLKNYHIFKYCTKYSNGDIYNWSDVSVIKIMNFKSNNIISDDYIRKISKYDGWKAIWHTSKKNGNLFNRLSVDMSDDQKRLLFWSMFYDNLLEHPECPSESIMNDDDAIDGWVIIQRRDREKEKGAKSVENKFSSSKMKNAQEVFLIAKDDKHAQQIENLNSDKNKAMKQARMNQLVKNSEMAQEEFADVKQKLYMEAVNKGREIMRGGGNGRR